jgi:hypothetical protein
MDSIGLSSLKEKGRDGMRGSAILYLSDDYITA